MQATNSVVAMSTMDRYGMGDVVVVMQKTTVHDVTIYGYLRDLIRDQSNWSNDDANSPVQSSRFSGDSAAASNVIQMCNY
jgi:outer membrane scaffolding protein for murein synthesis (MipA/OmpV family)